MNNLYVRLAAQNIKKHRRSYVPFMLAGVFVAAVSYILNSLSNNTELGPTSQMMFTLGSTVVMLFAVIFLFYTNSFLMKQRKKELGLYNVLGMNKGHIARVIGLETLFTALIVIVGGCAVGILLDKLTFLIVAKMIRITPNYGFHIIPKSLQYVAVVFGVIYVLIYISNVFRVRISRPIELLHGTNVGEREPKTKAFMAILGVLCLGSGYALSILSSREPVLAISLFFVAVLLVIIGTYFLFTAGSIALLKLLRRNKNYYYKTSHFISVSGMLYRTFSKAQKTLACNMPLMQFCMYACMLLVSWFGARLIVGGSMTTGELTSMFSYIMQILMSLMMVAMVFVMITMAKASAERVAELLSEKPDLHNPAQPVCEVKDGSIDFDAVDFSYKGDEHKLALRDVNLHVYSGQTIGILGGTGSAKSTLVQLIPRLYDVTRGSVKVGGVDVRDYDIETLRDEVAMVLQKNVLFSGTIKENLRWGNENASDDELVRVCRLAQADEFIQQMPDKYDTHIEQGGSNVSGGQKQRLCIARALLKKPKILILDDSTSAVDTKTDALIRRAFAEEIPNTTKIIIAQRVSSVQEADQIVILDGGAVQAIGTHDELLAENQIYQEIYNQQNRKGGEE